jgi:sporulation protein YabP
MVQQESASHGLRLEDRKKLTMTGVTEVLRLDEEAVVLKTGLGVLLVQGKGLQLKNLSPEGGQVELRGTVCALSYQEPKAATGRLRRLFQ